MHFGRTYPWLSPNDAANSSRAPSVERVESKACRSLPTECEDRRQVAITNDHSGCSDGARKTL